MKKINLWLLAATAMLFGACNNDGNIPEEINEKAIAPQLVATIEALPDTRAGVIEDADYTKGEKFYWSDGDETILFLKNENTSSVYDIGELRYKAKVEEDAPPSNNVPFELIGFYNVYNEEYSVYGFMPHNGYGSWAVNWSGGVLGMEFGGRVVQQTQSEPNSKHLGQYMPMTAKTTVEIDSDTPPIHLSYQHLAAVFRFAVWNNSSKPDLQLINIEVKLVSGKDVFSEHLVWQDVDIASPVVDNTKMKWESLNLKLTGEARNFRDKDDKKQCEGYMSVLPVPADDFDTDDELEFVLTILDGSLYSQVFLSYPIGTDADFLSSNGIEAGKSYYFRLKIDDSHVPDF